MTLRLGRGRLEDGLGREVVCGQVVLDRLLNGSGASKCRLQAVSEHAFNSSKGPSAAAAAVAAAAATGATTAITITA